MTRTLPLAASAMALLVFGFAPLALSPYWLSLLTIIFFYVCVGQAWNLMMGYTGILSLGNSLFLGLGGYVTAVLASRYGVVPWIGLPLGALVGAAMGVVIAWLGFRFSVRGVYFALLTIAFAEFFRILFDNWDYVGGAGGVFLPSLGPDESILLNLRGSGLLFYYAFLVLAAAVTAISALLVNGRHGFFWRAIREDEEAARALGVRARSMKILVVAISGAMTAVAGGLFGLMNGSLFPDSMLGMGMSIEIIIAPIIGGLGTLVGPIIGAFFVVPVTEIANDVGQHVGIFGLNTFVYGVMVFLVIVFLPEGIWPRLRRLATRRQRPDETDGGSDA